MPNFLRVTNRLRRGNESARASNSGGGAAVTVKRWIYLPTPADQQTITTIVPRDGKVVKVDREATC
jgi:hypothetical protein